MNDMTPAKYRKKPVVIEAMRWDGSLDGARAITEWSGGAVYVADDGMGDGKGRLLIWTLEGVMAVSVGDYVIKGVQGEFYPCKPDIFKATYEEVPDFQAAGN